MNHEKLEKNLIDLIKEEQAKLGYRKEEVRLYYPLQSLQHFYDCTDSADEMQRRLSDFPAAVRGTLGAVEVSHKGERLCFVIPENGTEYVRTQMRENEFICQLVELVGSHGTTMEQVKALFEAQNKQLEKARKKEYKQKKKEFEKNGWKIFGSTRSIDVALLKHYEALDKAGESAYELPGVASSFKSKNVGKQMALNSACAYYASMAGSKLQGRVVSDLAGDGEYSAEEFDKFYAAYKRSVEREIQGELKESFSVIREKADGTYEMQSFFIVDEDAASRARQRAFENSRLESIAAQKYASAVSNYINESFNPNE